MAPERRAAEAPGWLSRSAAVSWRPLAATWAVMGGAVLVIAGASAALAPQIGPEIGTLRDRVTTGLDDVQRWLRTGPLQISDTQLSDLLDRARQEAQTNSRALTRGLLSGATLAVEVVTGALLSLVLTFFFIKDGDRMGNWFANHAGARADDVRAAGRRAFETLGAYLRGQATVGLIDGVFIGIGLAVVGVPLAVPLVSLVSKGLVAALIIVGITIRVQQLEGHVLAPLVLGRAVKLHPAVILLALTGGGVVGGIIGAALAVPSVAVVTSVATYLRNRPPDPLPLGADGRAGVPQGQHDDRGGHRQGGEQDQHHAVVDPGDQPVGDGGGDRGGGDGDHPRPDDPPGDSPADR